MNYICETIDVCLRKKPRMIKWIVGENQSY